MIQLKLYMCNICGWVLALLETDCFLTTLGRAAFVVAVIVVIVVVDSAQFVDRTGEYIGCIQHHTVTDRTMNAIKPIKHFTTLKVQQNSY